MQSADDLLLHSNTHLTIISKHWNKTTADPLSINGVSWQSLSPFPRFVNFINHPNFLPAMFLVAATSAFSKSVSASAKPTYYYNIVFFGEWPVPSRLMSNLVLFLIPSTQSSTQGRVQPPRVKIYSSASSSTANPLSTSVFSFVSILNRTFTLSSTVTVRLLSILHKSGQIKRSKEVVLLLHLAGSKSYIIYDPKG